VLKSLIDTLLSDFGLLAVFAFVAIESLGIPLPGETMLVTAAVYAGATGKLSIELVLLCSMAGAIIGDNIGFMIGRKGGLRLLRRYGRYVRIDERRIKLGRYLFLRHGGKVVFFGRFVAVLRALAAVLAGINCMTWKRFLLFNALGGIVWAGAYGLGAYVFGETLASALSSLGLALGIAAAAAVVVGLVVARRFERRLEDMAERALPGPLEGPGGCAAPAAAEGE
jgi:membrane protein DedA with SNARE-associated domain